MIFHYFYCKGKQQCVNGTDEDYCEDLLLNECNSDTEYRCRNGMCIDEEYFLDGDIDCQDGTDEQKNLFIFYQDNCPILPNLNCDETKISQKNLFSCGDGQMIQEHMLLLQGLERSEYCFSYREKQWMCELDDVQTMWTNPKNGQCLNFVDETTDMEEVINCQLIIKCSFIRRDQHYLCPCAGSECLYFRIIYCKGINFPGRYPAGPVFTPFLQTNFDTSLNSFYQNRQPHTFSFVRSIKCSSEISALPNQFFSTTYSAVRQGIARLKFLPFELLLCTMNKGINHIKSNNANCWNDSHPNQAIYCPGYPVFDCISKYQVHDYIQDCLYGKPLFIFVHALIRYRVAV